VSYFLDLVNGYCRTYRVDASDRRRMLARYPLFKLAWLAESGSPSARRAAEAALSPLRRFGFTQHIPAADDTPMTLRVTFARDDLASFREVFFGGEYTSPFDLSSARTYVDLGANTGMAAYHFAATCRLDTVLLVEANPSLAEELRSKFPRAAVEHVCVVGDPPPGGVAFTIGSNPRHGSARADAGPGHTVVVPGIRLGELLDRHGLDHVDVLKMDIEGSEHEVLARDGAALARARRLFVEVHGDTRACGEFVRGIEHLGFSVAVRRARPEFGCETFAAERRAPPLAPPGIGSGVVTSSPCPTSGLTRDPLNTPERSP